MTSEPKLFDLNTLTSPPATAHGHNSSTFHPPPIEGTLCVPELFEYHAQHSPEHPLFVYADSTARSLDGNDGHTGDSDAQLRTIKYPEAWRMILRAARIVKGHYARFEDKYALQDRSLGVYGMPQDVPPAIGILANAGQASIPFRLVVRKTLTLFCHVIVRLDQFLLHHRWHHAPRTHPLPALGPKLTCRRSAPDQEDATPSGFCFSGPGHAEARGRG